MRKKEASKIKKNFTQIISTRGHGSSHVHSLIANFSKKKKHLVVQGQNMHTQFLQNVINGGKN